MPLPKRIIDPMQAIDYEQFIRYMREPISYTTAKVTTTSNDIIKEKDKEIEDLHEQLAELEDLYDKALSELDRANAQLEFRGGDE